MNLFYSNFSETQDEIVVNENDSKHIIKSYRKNIGEIITVGLPNSKSPIVDSDQDNDLTDEISFSEDQQNYSIISVTDRKESGSQVTFLAITPTGDTNITIIFYTTKK